jgi:hypothetical protein
VAQGRIASNRTKAPAACPIHARQSGKQRSMSVGSGNHAKSKQAADLGRQSANGTAEHDSQADVAACDDTCSDRR